MKKLVWLTVHGEQKYEGMSADSSELRVRGTMETTKDGYLLRYAINIGGQRGECALRVRVRTEEE